METHSVFNNLDYIVIGLVLLSGILALMRGFVRELFSLVTWVGAYLAAKYFYHPLLPWAHEHVKSDKSAEWLAMGIVFVVVLIVLSIVGTFVGGFIKGRALTMIDRSLGFLYGVARGGVVICLLYLCAVLVFWPNIDSEDDLLAARDHHPPPELLVTAKTRPLVASGAEMLKGLLPKELLDKTIESVEKQKEEADKAERQKQLDMMSTPAPRSTE